MANQKQKPLSSWSRTEFNQALAFALQCGREDYVSVLYLCRAGLRPAECFRLNASETAKAVEDGKLKLAGRTMPLDTLLTARLRRGLAAVPDGPLYLTDQSSAEAARAFRGFLRRCCAVRSGGENDA